MLSSCVSLKETWKMRVEDCAHCVWLLWVSKQSQHVSTASSKDSPVCFSWNFILTSAVFPGNIRNNHCKKTIKLFQNLSYICCMFHCSQCINHWSITEIFASKSIAPCSKPQVLFRFWIIARVWAKKRPILKDEHIISSVGCGPVLWKLFLPLLTYMSFTSACSSVGI